ncbi:MAG: HAD family hydrolase [Erysipelotrichaceae bacterium]
MKLIFIDIDGTLYSSKISGVPESSITAISKARNNGHKVFLCTGRTLGECLSHLKIEVDGYIFSAGNVIYVNKKRIFEQPIDNDSLKNLMSLVRKYDCGLTISGDAGAYGDKKGLDILGNYLSDGSNDEEIKNKELLKNGYFTWEHYSELDQIYAVGVMSDTLDPLYEIKKEIPERFGSYITLTEQDIHVYGMDIIDKSTNKAIAVKKVVNYLNMSMADTIAIGDSSNDLEMLKECNVGIAMGNASEACKQAADYVTDNILEHGLYNALKKEGVI